MTDKKTAKLPQFEIRAEFQPDTFNEDKRTVDVVWTTGARGLRQPFFGEPYYEELSVDADSVRLERLNGGGAPLLNNHNQNDLNDVIGVIEKASVDGEQGIATVRFSNRDEVKPIMNDVADGIVRNISVGYVVHEYERQQSEDENEEIPIYRAVDWEPVELSFVTVPFDSGAVVRKSEKTHNCVLRGGVEKEGPEMETKKVSGEGKTEPVVERGNEMNDAEKAKLKKEIRDAEVQRCSEIREQVKRAKLGDELADEFIKSGASVAELNARIVEEIAKRDEKNETVNKVTVEHGGQDERDIKRTAVESALLHRVDPKNNKLHEAGRQYMGMSLYEIGKSFVSRDHWGANKLETLDHAFNKRGGSHSSSDFPLILANVASKFLRESYTAAPATWSAITSMQTVNDFKQISRPQLGDGPVLEKVLEGGEIKRGSISEAQEQYKVETYAKIISVTRQMVINDDLSAFTRIPQMQGRRVADLNSDLVWAEITNNANMGDGNPLFDAAHGNVGVAGSLAVDKIGELRKLMRLQTGLDGQKLNIMPISLIVPAALETEAEKFVGQIQPDQAGNVNPFSGRLRVVAEPRLDDDSATAYYLAADTAQVDIIEMAHLAGGQAPLLETRQGFEVDAVEFKVRYDVGVKALDWRGLAKNAGA